MPETCASVHPHESKAQPPLPASYQQWTRQPVAHEWSVTRQALKRIYASDTSPAYQRFLACRSQAHFTVNTQTRMVRVSSNGCRNRWCPVCAQAKSRFVAHQVSDWLAEAIRPKLLTLTIRHSDAPLIEQFNALYRHFRNLRRDAFFRCRCAGGIWFLQVKLAKDGKRWHPHIHCVIDSSYMPQIDLSLLWQRITHTSRIVDIRIVREVQDTSDYVSRYVARPSNLAHLSPDQRVELVQSLQRRHVSGTWGSARIIRLSTPTKPPEGVWNILGTWSDVITFAQENSELKQLIKSWKSGQPLPDWCMIEPLDGRAIITEEATTWDQYTYSLDGPARSPPP